MNPHELIDQLQRQGFYGSLDLVFVRGQVLCAHKNETIKFAKPQPTRETRERQTDHDPEGQ